MSKMKRIMVEVPCALVGLPCFSATVERPNIVLFLVDDMGWQETSVPFYAERTPLNDRYRTPNMERLAAQGVKFMQAYACSVSSPSRCSLLSGMNAARHGVTNWTLHYDQQTDAKSPNFTPPAWNWNGIQPDTVSREHDRRHAQLITALPELLKRAGYYTIHCGKAHFGAETTAGADPTNFGFMVNIGGAANGAPGSYLAQESYGQGSFHVRGLEKYYARGTFLTEALTQEAIAALRKPIAEGRPFFLYMAHYAIHVPYDADTRFTSNYVDSTGQGIEDRQLGARLNRQEINHAALVEGMDKSLGDLMDYLESQPDVARNTIILFMSDNGGQGVGPRQGRHNRDQNWPARGGKGSALMGGVREPMIVAWPGVTKGGSECHAPVIIEDFFPTLLDMAGVENRHTSQHIDGRSFAPLLTKGHQKNAARPYTSRRSLVWHFPNLWGESIDEANGYGATSSLLRGEWHLIYYWATDRVELYNIREDIGEEHDCAQERPRLARSMKKRLLRALRRMGAATPR